MQLTTAFILFIAASVTSGWKFTGWVDKNYQGYVAISRSGVPATTDKPCVNIAAYNNKLSSYKWDQGDNSQCQFKLYDSYGCKDQLLASSYADKNAPAISGAYDNKASSLWVDC